MAGLKDLDEFRSWTVKSSSQVVLLMERYISPQKGFSVEDRKKECHSTCGVRNERIMLLHCSSFQPSYSIKLLLFLFFEISIIFLHLTSWCFHSSPGFYHLLLKSRYPQTYLSWGVHCSPTNPPWSLKSLLNIMARIIFSKGKANHVAEPSLKDFLGSHYF